MDLKTINDRVDRALRANARAEKITVGLAVAIFAIGVLTIVLAYQHTNSYVASGTALLQGFLYWPIATLRQLWRENVSLQVVPVLVSSLPPDQAGAEIVKLLAFVQTGKRRWRGQRNERWRRSSVSRRRVWITSLALGAGGRCSDCACKGTKTYRPFAAPPAFV